MDTRSTPTTRGPLARLRTIRPDRHLTMDEARSVAERQAAMLIDYLGADLPIGLDHFDPLPRICLTFDGIMPDRMAGSSHWTGTEWVIAINRNHPTGRQRFTAFHELHHIIEHPFRRFDGEASAEVVADHFSACVLMPRAEVKRAWCGGIQRLAELADIFEVSEQAMKVRLVKLGLINGTEHACRRRYFQMNTSHRPVHAPGTGGRA